MTIVATLTIRESLMYRHLTTTGTANAVMSFCVNSNLLMAQPTTLGNDHNNKTENFFMLYLKRSATFLPV